MKENELPTCRMCGTGNEAVIHIFSECEKLAQEEYRKRRYRVVMIIYWELCKQYGFERCEKWFNYRAEHVLENNDFKILWDFNIWCDRMMASRRPDIVADLLYK